MDIRAGQAHDIGCLAIRRAGWRFRRALMTFAGGALMCLLSACTPNILIRHELPLAIGEAVPGSEIEARIHGDYSRGCVHPGDPPPAASASPSTTDGSSSPESTGGSGRHCKAHAVEVHPTYRLFFVEFDEQGRLRDDRQLETLFSYLERRNKCGAGLSVVTFVHGWRHDSSYADENVTLARDVLKEAAEAEAVGLGSSLPSVAVSSRCNERQWTGAEAREVIGIYVGWRGQSLDGLGIPALGEFWEWLSVWDRKGTAQDVATGSVLELFSRIRAFQARVNRNGENGCDARLASYYQCKRVRLAIVGHSFGGLLVFNAISPSLIESLALSEHLDASIEDNCSVERPTPEGGPGLRVTKPPATPEAAAARTPGSESAIVSSFADLVVLLNPAMEGARFDALHQAVLRRANKGNGFCRNQRPVLVVLTADNDFATNYAFPFMRWFEALLEDTHPLGGNGGNPAAELARHQEAEEATRQAVGHIERFQTHVLRSSADEARRDPRFKAALDSYCGAVGTDPVQQALRRCRCSDAEAPSHEASCAVFLEDINASQMLRPSLEGSLNEVTRAERDSFLYTEPNWRRLYCGGIVLSQLPGNGKPRQAGDGVQVAGVAAVKGKATKAREVGGFSPVWVIKSHDESFIDNHGGIGEPKLRRALRALYREISVDPFNEKGFGAMGGRADELYRSCVLGRGRAGDRVIRPGAAPGRAPRGSWRPSLTLTRPPVMLIRWCQRFRSFPMSTTIGQISAWGNGLAIRLTKPMAKAAGVAEGSPIRVTVKPGRIVIETGTEPTLEQMLAAFDPKKHGGEAMADEAVGMEAFADGNP